MSNTLPPGAVPPVDPSAPPSAWSLRQIASRVRGVLRGQHDRAARLLAEEARGARDLDDLLQGLESAASDLQRGLAALAAELRRLEAGQAALAARQATLEAWRLEVDAWRRTVDAALAVLAQRLGVARG